MSQSQPPIYNNTLRYRVDQLERKIEHLELQIDRRIGALEAQLRKLMWMIVTSSISLTTALLALALALATR